MTHPDHKFAGLDHLRALAISLVFLYHYHFSHHPEWMNNVVGFGWSGVDLFFVLSGFLISNQLLTGIKSGENIKFGIFYIKRFFRIIPPYLTVLLVYIFVPAFHERETLPPLWRMFTFTQNFGLNIQVYGTFSHAWSLCIEEQFYLVLPFVISLVFISGAYRKAVWIIPGIFISTLLIRMLIWHVQLEPLQNTYLFGESWYKWIYYPTYTRLDGLVTGVGIAVIYQYKENWRIWVNRYANYFLLAAALLFITAYIFCADQQDKLPTLYGFSLVAITYGFFVLSAISPRSLLFKFRFRITERLATFSYAIYLSHKGLIHVTQQVLKGSMIKEDSNEMLFVCIVVCIGGAFLIRLVIEKPFFSLRDKLIGRLKR